MKKRRLSKDDWLDLGLTALSEDGADALKLDAICARAALTKGSFYHHFKDHVAFLEGVVYAWKQAQTDNVIAEAQHASNPDDIANALLEQALEMDFALELGVRELARRNETIDAIVKDVDEARAGFMTQLYSQRFGRDETEVKDAAFLEYAAFAGFMMLVPDMTTEKQRHLANLYDDMVMTYFNRGTS